MIQHNNTWIVCLSHADVVAISSSSCRFISIIYSACIFKTHHYLTTTKRASYAVYSVTTSCHGTISWRRHQMETFSAWLALCAGNSPVPVNSPHKGQWRGALMFTLICVWINGCVNNREAGDLRRYCAHYVVTVMFRINITVWGDSPHKGPAMRIFVDKFVVSPNTCSANSRISMTLIWRYYNVMGCILFNVYSDHSEYGLSQLETTLHCNVVSHWLNPHSE